MDANDAATALSALALESRIEIFRLLVQSGPDGMNAGDIAVRLGAKASTLSNNLGILKQASLIRQTRSGRNLHYSARYDRMGDLISFLLEDCCAGSPEVCQPLVELAARFACCDQPKGALS